MIIQVRGTSGSGKSTVMREVKDKLKIDNPVYIPGRKRPLYYIRDDKILLGHYEIDCGGCDTIGSAPNIYDTILLLPSYGFLLTEGLLWSEDVKWTLKLSEVQDVNCIFLTTPLEECLNRVKQRQGERNPKDPDRVKRKLSKRIETIERARIRLTDLGVTCRRCSSSQAPKIILSWLGYTLAKGK